MSKVYRWYGKEDRECYVFQVDGNLYHAHDNASGWSTRRLTLSTLEHHVIMNHGIQTVREMPDGLQSEIDAVVESVRGDTVRD